MGAFLPHFFARASFVVRDGTLRDGVEMRRRAAEPYDGVLVRALKRLARVAVLLDTTVDHQPGCLGPLQRFLPLGGRCVGEWQGRQPKWA
jgi:hypothetical protein